MTSANFMKRYITLSNLPAIKTAPFISEKITIPNPQSFIHKLNKLKRNPSQIQFISDFDYTLTKFRHENKQCDSLFGMWTRCDALPKKFIDDLIKNYQEYGPYETDGTISFEDRAYLVNQFYKIQTKLFSKYQITQYMMEEVIKNADVVFRSHSSELFDTLLQYQIPLYIISGGISDVIYNSIHSLTNKKIYPNISIHSNELQHYSYSYSEQQAQYETLRFIKFKKTLIHSYNKYRVMNHVNKRKNCFLLGDLVSDIYMAQGNNYETIMSVFYGKQGETDQRAQAQKKFDIIVEGDNSHKILIQLLKIIHKKPQIDWKYLYNSSSKLHDLVL